MAVKGSGWRWVSPQPQARFLSGSRSKNTDSRLTSSHVQHHVERCALVTTASFSSSAGSFTFCSSAVEKMSHFFSLLSLVSPSVSFSPPQQQPNYWSFKVSASVACVCESVALCVFASHGRTLPCVGMPVCLHHGSLRSRLRLLRLGLLGRQTEFPGPENARLLLPPLTTISHMTRSNCSAAL